jgi:hypothetical protein
MYGSAWRNGLILSEVIEVSGAVEVAQIDVPLVGQTKMGHKPGRETRSGTLRIQKIDSKWEIEIWELLSQNLRTRRSNRDRGVPNQRPFQLQVEYDDPDALGIEKWVLEGCLIWRLPLGFSIGDDIVEREFPFTWEKETPLYAFTTKIAGNGTPSADYYGSPPPGV